MRIQYKLGAVIATFALGFAPALAIAAHPNNGKHGSQSHSQANAHAFGKLCRTESKRHVAGMKGTPYSQCVVAAAHLLGNHGGTGTSTSGTGSTSTPAPTTTG